MNLSYSSLLSVMRGKFKVNVGRSTVSYMENTGHSMLPFYSLYIHHGHTSAARSVTRHVWRASQSCFRRRRPVVTLRVTLARTHARARTRVHARLSWLPTSLVTSRDAQPCSDHGHACDVTSQVSTSRDSWRCSQAYS